MRDAAGIRGEARVARQLGPLDDALAEKTEVTIGPASDRERAIAGVEELIGNDRWMGIAVPARFAAGDERALGDIDQRRQGRAEERDLNARAAAVALAREERGADRAMCVVRGEHVRQRD